MSDAERRLLNKDTKTHCGCHSRGVIINAFGNLVRKRFHKESCKYARKK